MYQPNFHENHLRGNNNDNYYQPQVPIDRHLQVNLYP